MLTIYSIEKRGTSKSWLAFSEKIAKKYLFQGTTLQNLFSFEFYKNSNEKEARFIDFSSIFILLRTQLENYAVFHHLFIGNCHTDEKILRFRLWELDGYLTYERIGNFDDPKNAIKKIAHDKGKETCIKAIGESIYFQRLDQNTRDYLVENALWRFTDNSLKNKNKNEWNIRISGIIANTGIKHDFLADWYAVSSRYIHTLFPSVVHMDVSNEEDEIMAQYVSTIQGAFITSFFITDFASKFAYAREFFDSCSDSEKEVINSFSKLGKDKL